MAHIAVGDILSQDTAALQLWFWDPRLKFILPHLCSVGVGARCGLWRWGLEPSFYALPSPRTPQGRRGQALCKSPSHRHVSSSPQKTVTQDPETQRDADSTEKNKQASKFSREH